MTKSALFPMSGTGGLQSIGLSRHALSHAHSKYVVRSTPYVKRLRRNRVLLGTHVGLKRDGPGFGIFKVTVKELKSKALLEHNPARPHSCHAWARVVARI